MLLAILGTVQSDVLPLPKRNGKATLKGVDCSDRPPTQSGIGNMAGEVNGWRVDPGSDERIAAIPIGTPLFLVKIERIGNLRA